MSHPSPSNIFRAYCFLFLLLCYKVSCFSRFSRCNLEKHGVLRTRTVNHVTTSSQEHNRGDTNRHINILYHPDRSLTNPFGVFTFDSTKWGRWFSERGTMNIAPRDKYERVAQWCRIAQKWGVLNDPLQGVMDDYQRHCTEHDITFDEDTLNKRLLVEFEENVFAHRHKEEVRGGRKPRLIVIGDVHGCLEELRCLLKKCEYCLGDALLFLGDLVGKGPDSVKVVQMAYELGALCVKGNHDQYVIESEHGVGPYSKIAEELGSNLLTWLKTCPPYFKCDMLDAVFVHAGFIPNVDYKNQRPHLMSTLCSIDEEKGIATDKLLPGKSWGRLWRGPLRAYFGHDSGRGLQYHPHALGIDTGCVYGDRLTACLLPGEKLVSIRAKQVYRKDRRQSL